MQAEGSQRINGRGLNRRVRLVPRRREPWHRARRRLRGHPRRRLPRSLARHEEGLVLQPSVRRSRDQGRIASSIDCAALLLAAIARLACSFRSSSERDEMLSMSSGSPSACEMNVNTLHTAIGATSLDSTNQKTACSPIRFTAAVITKDNAAAAQRRTGSSASAPHAPAAPTGVSGDAQQQQHNIQQSLVRLGSVYGPQRHRNGHGVARRQLGEELAFEEDVSLGCAAGSGAGETRVSGVGVEANVRKRRRRSRGAWRSAGRIVPGLRRTWPMNTSVSLVVSAP